MPDSLLFDGSNDEIEVGPGGIIHTGPLTAVAIFKIPSASSTYDIILGLDSTGDSADFGLSDDNPPKGFWNSGVGVESSPTISFTAAEGWCLLAYSKPDGSTVTSRWHKYVYNTDTWTHENETSPGESAGSITGASLGIANDGGARFAGNLLIVGWWNSNLSDGAIEALVTGKQAWIDASPAEAWRCDTMSTITSFVGSSAETSRIDTSLDTGDAPAGWSDDEGFPPGSAAWVGTL